VQFKLPQIKIKIKKYAAFAVALLFIFSAKSQPRMIKSTMSLNDPDAGFIQLTGEPFVVDYPSGFSLQATGRYYNKHYFGQITGNINVLNIPALSVIDYSAGTSVYAPTLPRFIDVTAGYFFKNNKYFDARFGLRSYGNISEFAVVRVLGALLYGPEAGMVTGFDRLDFSNNDLHLRNYYSGTSTHITQSFSTFREYIWLYAGFSITKFINSRVTFEDYGDRRNQSTWRSYLHVIVPVYTSLEDVYLDLNTIYTGRFVTDDLPRTPVGFRIGTDFTPISNILGFGFQAGLHPGIDGAFQPIVKVKLSLAVGWVLKTKE
jgi:hypothetical protein